MLTEPSTIVGACGACSSASLIFETVVSQVPERVRVVIPAFGHHHLTHEVIGDLMRESEVADVVVVDNRGDYPAMYDENVVRPERNLGWAGGTNFGASVQPDNGYAGFIWLNNDTRLSHHFIQGLIDCWRDTGAGLIGPTYDCYWHHQRAGRPGPVDRYKPRRRHFAAPFLDGTCLFVPKATTDAIGWLDSETFGPVGWGADLDYCLRAKAQGLRLAVTRLSYLHHEKSVTGASMYGDGLSGYAREGHPVMMEGLRAKWGDDWYRRAGIALEEWQTRPPRWRERIGRTWPTAPR